MGAAIPAVNMAEPRLQGFKVHALPAFVEVPEVGTGTYRYGFVKPLDWIRLCPICCHPIRYFL
jgi:hypothetical protein